MSLAILKESLEVLKRLTNQSEKSDDGKSYVNPETGVLSEAYEKFVDPIDNGKRGGL